MKPISKAVIAWAWFIAWLWLVAYTDSLIPNGHWSELPFLATVAIGGGASFWLAVWFTIGVMPKDKK